MTRFTASPHQFDVGRQVYLRGHAQPLLVTGHRTHRGWPHYQLEDVTGGEWLASQLELSSKPFSATWIR